MFGPCSRLHQDVEWFVFSSFYHLDTWFVRRDQHELTTCVSRTAIPDTQDEACGLIAAGFSFSAKARASDSAAGCDAVGATLAKSSVIDPAANCDYVQQRSAQKPPGGANIISLPRAGESPEIWQLSARISNVSEQSPLGPRW